MKRRSFIKNTTLAGIGLSAVNPVSSLPKNKITHNTKEKIQIGLIGCGLRGQNHLNLLLKREDCHVAALCDIDERMIQRSMEMVDKNNKSKPKIYSEGPHDYINMLEKEDLDAVIISTPWEWHVPMAVESLNHKIYTGLEVSGASSVEECWELVRASEKNRTPVYFLENVCFRRDVMAVLQMVREGLFGELIHLEGGYQHDLRGVKFNDGITPYDSGVEFGDHAFSEAKWRTQHSIHRNGDLYPTHGIGPIAQYIDINRGNRFEYLTSMSSKSKGLHNYIVDHPKGGNDHPNASVEFRLGDKITTSIRTVHGETIILHHDTNLPRPYSLGFRVQGTRGLWMDINKSLHIEGMSPSHRWEEAQPYFEKYDHPLWKRFGEIASGAGHGGMDFFLIHSFVEHVKRAEDPPFDVYDAAAWKVITPLSEESIAMGSKPVYFPDFSNGKWINRKNTFAYHDQY